MAKFLSMGGKDTFDVFGYHFYTEAGNPERAVILEGRIDRGTQGQLLNVATRGCGTPNPAIRLKMAQWPA